MPNYPKKD